MRFYSTTESVKRGELSALAILETLSACAFLFWLSFSYNTTKWLAGAVCLAPLTLLRTQESIDDGIKWLRYVHNHRKVFNGYLVVSFVAAATVVLIYFVPAEERPLGQSKEFFVIATVSIFWCIAIALFQFLIFLAIRVVTTVSNLIKSPFHALQSLPQNWSQIVLATDSAVEPELLPNKEDYSNKQFNISPSMEPVARMFALPPLYALAIAYRWSIKSTFVIFLPFIWIVRKGQFSPENLRIALDDYQSDDLQRLRNIIALILIFVFLIKVVALVWFNRFVDFWAQKEELRQLNFLLVPRQIPLWQIASALNSLLALCLWRYARQKLRQLERKSPVDELQVLRTWRAATIVASILSLYTIACTMTILVKEGMIWPSLRALWEAVGKKFWP